MDSRFNTVRVPAAAEGLGPVLLVRASENNPVRVVVTNPTVNIIALAHEIAELLTGAFFVLGQAGIYQLPGHAEDTFVLAPGQAIFAIGIGGAANISIATSTIERGVL